ncbi:MAG: NAD(+)/NADH kinase [Acidobacteriota bacterium]|nr:NAD(+)/NADH kinase [Blastocatellia bacterium]MDW8239946.1 NAD(+)/NADH kinase [Acidobacteriota bacterium]
MQIRRRIHLQRVGVVIKPTLDPVHAGEVLCRLSGWLTEHGIELVAEPVLHQLAPNCQAHIVPREEMSRQVDLIIVLGGDGTMIATARSVAQPPVPVLGVNFGGLGYLTEFTLDELFPALQMIRDGDFAVQRRMMLDASLWRQGEWITTHTVLNDAVVNKGSLARMIQIECLVDDRYVTTLRADGFIVATPTGSTAYSLSAGGPIVYPTMEAILITPVCPHTLTNRPLVIPSESTVKLILRSAREEVTLTLDGQTGIALQCDDQVIVRRSQKFFEVVQPPEKNYFQVLRDKLLWGA